MKRMWKRIAALLTVCLLLVPLCAGSAMALDLDSDCSITVFIQTSEDGYTDLSWANAVVDFYQVATAVPAPGDSDNFDLKLLAPFASLQEDLDSYSDWGSDREALAQKAARIIFEGGAEPVISGWYPLQEAPVGDPGMYLIVVRGEDLRNYVTTVEVEHVDPETGETYYTEEISTFARDAYYEYLFNPVLVTVPTRGGLQYDPETGWQETGDWLYHAPIVVKTDPQEWALKKIILHKEDENGNRLPYAKFKLYATRLADPAKGDVTDTLVTYVEGIGYVTLFCQGEYTTDRNGNIVIRDPVLDDSTLYAWVEVEAPAGYELDPEPHFFFAYGMLEGFDGYADYLNAPGYLETQLRFDPDFRDNTGSVRLERGITGNQQNLTFQNVSEEETLWLRVYVYGSEEGVLDGESLGSFLSTVSGEGWTLGDDGYFYHDEFLAPGDIAQMLQVMVEGPAVYADENDEYALPNTFRTPIVYDVSPVQLDADGNPYADWRWDPMDPSWDEINGLAPSLRPMAEAHGGYVIELEGYGAKSTGRAYHVDSVYYDREVRDTESGNGMTVINKKSNENPPDEPGTELPSTGGTGVIALYIAGSGLVAISLFLFAVRKRLRA